MNSPRFIEKPVYSHGQGLVRLWVITYTHTIDDMNHVDLDVLVTALANELNAKVFHEGDRLDEQLFVAGGALKSDGL